MSALGLWQGLTRAQRNAFLAAFAGWSLDAFDFFVFTFCLSAIGTDFHTDITAVTEGIFLTLAFRPVGALVFGWLAERYGRRPVLILNVCTYSLVQLATAASPNLTVLLALRALFGVAMGGVWGVGAALALETLPAQSRGFFSGLLQQGYAAGYLLAAAVFAIAFERVGWRGMFVIGALPALLAFFIGFAVEESPAWAGGGEPRGRPEHSTGDALRGVLAYWPRLIYLVILMACFNAFSHGSQDLYPTFLKVQHHFTAAVAGAIAIVVNVGALIGGVSFGILSERIGRRRAIIAAAALALPMIPLWAFAQNLVLLAVGGFLMQLMVQGAWGVVPAHLNELSPPGVRAILPGFAYQLGNLAVSRMTPVQSRIAESHGGNFGLAMAGTMVVVSVALIIVTSLGTEARGARLDAS